ncbi:MAG: cation transporter [Candidatus Lokiarchaeota archaeon]|nr:cation transporter [Candidatus Lokiarchaeota archaeon]
MHLSELKEKYSKKELLYGPHTIKKEFPELFKNSEHQPHTDYFYGFLGLIYDGENNLEAIRKKMRLIFISSTKHLVVEDQDIEEYLQYAKKRKLIKIKENIFIELTHEGIKLVELCYYITLHNTYWMRKFFSEKSVMIATTISLIFLSILKIIVGISLGSQGMLNEGFENFIDLVKVAIIVVLCLKLKKDKLSSIIIIGFMLITGLSLLWTSINSLMNPSEIIPTIQAYLIGFFSIIINGGLMYLKSMVGRISGNLSILSDSKDSQMNIYISTGVLIGFTFSIFNFYFMDAIVGLIIALFVIKEGGEILMDLLKNEENFDITEIKVMADQIYNNRLTGYILASIRRESINHSELINNFKKGLDIGRTYYEGFADFFYKELGTKVIEKHLERLIKGGFIEELDEKLILTLKGLKYFYKAKSREFRYRYKNIHQKGGITKGALFCLVMILCIILVAIFANDINNWLFNL